MITDSTNNDDLQIKYEAEIDYTIYIIDFLDSTDYSVWRENRNFCDGQLASRVEFIRSQLGLQRIEELSQPRLPPKIKQAKSEVFTVGLELLLKVVTFALDESHEEWLKAGLALSRLLGEITAGLIFARDLAACYFSQGDYQVAVDYNEKILSEVSEQINARQQGEILSNLGLALAYLGQYDKAVTYYEQAIPILQKEKAIDREGFCHAGIGWAYGDRGYYDKGLEAYQRGLNLARQASDKVSEGVRLGAIGILNWQLGDADLAIENLNNALKIALINDDNRRVGTRRYDLGMIYRHLGDYDTAFEKLTSSINLAREDKVKDQRGIGVRSGVLGECHADRGNFTDALKHQIEGLTILNTLSLLKYRVYATIGLGETYLMMMQYDKALAYLEEGLKLADQVKNPAAQLTANGALARVYLHTNRLSLALEHSSGAVKYSVPQHDHNAHLIQGIICLQLNMRVEAKVSLSKAVEAAQKLLTKTPRLYRPQYTLALAQAGLALLVNSDDPYIAQSKTNLQLAFDSCAEKGIINDMRCVFKEISKQDKNGLLTSIQAIFF